MVGYEVFIGELSFDKGYITYVKANGEDFIDAKRMVIGNNQQTLCLTAYLMVNLIRFSYVNPFFSFIFRKKISNHDRKITNFRKRARKFKERT